MYFDMFITDLICFYQFHSFKLILVFYYPYNMYFFGIKTL